MTELSSNRRENRVLAEKQPRAQGFDMSRRNLCAKDGAWFKKGAGTVAPAASTNPRSATNASRNGTCPLYERCAKWARWLISWERQPRCREGRFGVLSRQAPLRQCGRDPAPRVPSSGGAEAHHENGSLPPAVQGGRHEDHCGLREVRNCLKPRVDRRLVMNCLRPNRWIQPRDALIATAPNARRSGRSICRG